ncbi:type II CRISPR RNA-guided endonuclease Cas9 [Vagococcus hydrophili]|uniref:CRISPR-associated endonuclease Cas9 n=1 Tax=Vagococcus hydrophili TaxID=2714947 RepID=A0A6G8AVJ4_9ENTE|nr:type II CRISPR RNA-guided endonuclease Cas9 [Vagococcus hydrophili]QIL48933.1 type II CRISPR RNA-guided endonuclease Cas9 [Vagococcus hydrophili]
MYSIGLDIGIASCGWSVINDKNGHIVDLGVSLFSSKNSANNLDRRTSRGSRRLLRRRVTRLSDAKKILEIISCIEEDQLKNTDPYQLRVKGLTEQLTKSEIYRVVMHIVKKRGISYLDEDSEEGAKESQDYKNQVLHNSDLLKTLTPGQIQLQRLNEMGRVKTGINQSGNYQLNVFTVSSYANELERILECQQKFYPEITSDFIDKFINKETGESAGLVYRKRPYYHGPGNMANHSQYGRWIDYNKNGQPAENIFDKLIGTDIQGELRASASSLSAQKFNLFNDLNNLRLPREEDRVTEDEKRKILSYLMGEEITRFGANDLAKLLGYKSNEIKGWRVNKNDKPEIHSMKVYRDWRDIFSNYDVELNEIPCDTIDGIAKVITLNTELDGIINTLDIELPELDGKIKKVICDSFKELRKKTSSSSWHSFSLKTLSQMIPFMLANPMEQNTVLEELKLKTDLRNTYADYTKIPIKEITKDIYNPTVNKSVSRAFHVMNALVEKYGKEQISYVTIEMPRDKNEDDQKKTIKNIQKTNENRKKQSENFFLEQSGWSQNRFESEMRKRGFAAKLGYFFEQNGRCAYSGESIKAESLTSNATEIDHVIPLSISLDDSMNNKVLVKAQANQEKGQRTPYQAYQDGAKLGQTWDEYKTWVINTYKKKHKRRILLETRDIFDPEVRNQFIARNLNDTRYASRVVLNSVQSFFNKSETKVQVVTGNFTHTLRKKWGESLEKTRETHHHHAVDAALCAIVPFVKVSRFVYYYDPEGSKYMVDQETGEKIPYHEYKKMKPDERRSYVPKWDDFIGQLVPTLLYPKIKFSHQVDYKSNRKVSDATIYSTRQVEKISIKRGKEIKTEETFILDKIKDIYTVEGWKEFKKYQDKILAKENDPETFKILCEIAEEYPKSEEIQEPNGNVKAVDRSPFERYCSANDVPGIQKYSKKGNGPYIKSLKYYNKKIGSHVNITRDEFGNMCDETKNGKKVVLLSLNPWRTDVYYNKELDQFELLGIKYNHLKFVNGEYGVPIEVYDELKVIEKISRDSEFCFSLYRKSRVLIEEGEEQIQGLFSSRTKSNTNYFELKPIDKDRWDKTEDVPLFGKVSNGQFIKRLRSDMKITKINTDHLGKCYYVKKETLKNIIS